MVQVSCNSMENLFLFISQINFFMTFLYIHNIQELAMKFYVHNKVCNLEVQLHFFPTSYNQTVEKI